MRGRGQQLSGGQGGGWDTGTGRGTGLCYGKRRGGATERVCGYRRVLTWREGEAIIFDDSLEHWVAFDAEPTAQRIVLVVDVPHPDLRGTTNR